MPSPLDICITIPPLGDPFRLPLPGGVSIEHLDLNQVLQPALTPLMPLLDLVGAVVSVFECLKAVPATIGPPPDPTALASALEKLSEKVAKLLQLVPQLSLPLTVLGMIDLLIQTLKQARDQLMHLQGRQQMLAAVFDRGHELGDEGLLQLAECSQQNIAQEAGNVGKQLAALGAIIDLVNLFMGLIGGPEVPDLSSLNGQGLDVVLAPLDALVETLSSVRSAVPIP